MHVHDARVARVVAYLRAARAFTCDQQCACPSNTIHLEPLNCLNHLCRHSEMGRWWAGVCFWALRNGQLLLYHPAGMLDLHHTHTPIHTGRQCLYGRRWLIGGCTGASTYYTSRSQPLPRPCIVPSLHPTPCLHPTPLTPFLLTRTLHRTPPAPQPALVYLAAHRACTCQMHPTMQTRPQVEKRCPHHLRHVAYLVVCQPHQLSVCHPHQRHHGVEGRISHTHQ